LSEELFAKRDLLHQLQTVVSRQGEPIESVEPLRERLEHLTETQETAPTCPEDWGAVRIVPDLIEFWSESPDRLHDRRQFRREGDAWRETRLAP
jgi:pyridoxamine 5'-phosphate oxidase